MALALRECFGLDAGDDLVTVREALYRQARHLGAGHPEAEDLVHDALVRYLEHEPELRRPGAFRAWLGTTMARLWADRHRRTLTVVSRAEL